MAQLFSLPRWLRPTRDAQSPDAFAAPLIGYAPRDVAREYLATAKSFKLHLGREAQFLDGWLNADAAPSRDGVMQLNPVIRFPLPSGVFTCIYSNQHIQDSSESDGIHVLGECLRILELGGVLRVATLDRARVAELGRRSLSRKMKCARDWFVAEYLEDVVIPDGAFIVSSIVSLFGHQCLYDRHGLERSARRAGFRALEWMELGESEHPALVGVDTPKETEAQVFFDLLTMILELTKI